MSEKEFHKQLVTRYLSNRATPEEVEVFLHLSAEGKLDDVIGNHLESVLANAPTSQSAIKPLTKTNYSLWLSIAASILIALVAFAYLYNHNKQLVKPSPTSQLVKKNNAIDFIPGSNKAILTLEDGKEVVLDSTRKGILAIQNMAIINMAASGAITYEKTDTLNYIKPSYNIITTPRGGQYQVVLADGTKVWLNAQSSLRYPTYFTGPERKVELTGEGYFEVAHNAGSPFIVVTGKHQVTVLGTHFNINAYTDERQVRTTLLEGSVMVSDVSTGSSAMLSPGNQSQYEKNFKIVKADMEEAVAWKNGYFVFNNESMGSVMRKISRWYNVDIVYADDVSGKAIWGSVSKFKNVSEILNVLALTGAVEFKVRENMIEVKKTN